MNPTLEQLARYVAQELARGVPETTLYASLRESGWTVEWINAGITLAKQQVRQSSNALTMPAVQDPLPQRRLPAMPARPAPLPDAPRPQKVKRRLDIKKFLIVLIIILTAITAALAAYRTITGLNEAATQRVIRDADRREDLSVLLSNLSDYYITHKSYPTRNQLNNNDFLQKNGFNSDSITDPGWSEGNTACVKNGKPSLAGAPASHCYAYEVSTAKAGEICDNNTIPCTKVTVTISLEVEEQTYAVTFDKNTQVDR